MGEQLASINTHEYSTIAGIRGAFVEVLRSYLRTGRPSREAEPGEEFYFIRSHSFVFPTPYVVRDLKGFVDALRKATISSLYFHMFEAKLRLARGGNDFSFWLETSLQEKALAQWIARLDPYTHTMEQLRSTIIRLVERRIRQIRRSSTYGK